MLKVGIFFGGLSREREISFAGGRTVYDNLDKSLFEAVPVFVDSAGNFILLDWQFIYKGTIRDFYPPADTYRALNEAAFSSGNDGKHPPFDFAKFQLYIESLASLSEEEIHHLIHRVGKKIHPGEFKKYFDFAFLTLHGPYGEDGNIQGLLEWYGIPYSGCGILPSSIGINKIIQGELLKEAGFYRPKTYVLSKKEWLNSTDKAALMEKLIGKVNFPLVIKSPNQGSTIGVSILKEKSLPVFENAILRSFFIKKLHLQQEWATLSFKQKENFLLRLSDIRDQLGFPVWLLELKEGKVEEIALCHLPGELYHHLEKCTGEGKNEVYLQSIDSEEQVIVEEYLEGREFSCIVIEDENGDLIALPPTEIIKFNELFDYRSKYLPGTSRKITPIETTEGLLENIRKECCRLFRAIHCSVYARIDGFISKEGKIYLNDPNTTSGMMPSSFFFHQAAEIGLNPSQLLTYIIRTSLSQRIRTGKRNFDLEKTLHQLDTEIELELEHEQEKIPVAVIMGGYSTERHISMESGRNVYEKLASSVKYHPVPVFLTGSENNFEMYVIPIRMMLKDNVDDIRDKIIQYKESPEKAYPAAIERIKQEAEQITRKYVGKPLMHPVQIDLHELAQKVKEVFIALHGRPGEDGALQQELEILELPYNGSGISSSQVTINKYETNETLRINGLLVALHNLVYQQNWEMDPEAVLKKIEAKYTYPLIAKPVDDGCSSAVKKIKSREELIAYAEVMFRSTKTFPEKAAYVLNLKPNEEFPQKGYFLIEELIEKGDARHFLEITGGLLTHLDEKTGEITYEIFEPSEALALGDILSLEEKFLAGEGQNITPALYSPDPSENHYIAGIVKDQLKKVAELLHIEGYARIDAFVKIYDDRKVEVYIIEVNSLPGMTPATCIFHQSAINHYTPYQFIDAILNFAYKKKQLSLSIPK